MSTHAGEKCGKLHISYILSSQRGITPSKINAKWRHSNLICSTLKQISHAKFQLNMSKHVGEKREKLLISYILSSQRGITPEKKIDAKWRHTNLICSTLEQSKMQNFSSIFQSMKEKSAENCTFPILWVHISYILSSQRGITPSKIDAKWRHSNLIRSTLKQSHVQNFSAIYQSM